MSSTHPPPTNASQGARPNAPTAPSTPVPPAPAMLTQATQTALTFVALPAPSSRRGSLRALVRFGLLAGAFGIAMSLLSRGDRQARTVTSTPATTQSPRLPSGNQRG